MAQPIIVNNPGENSSSGGLNFTMGIIMFLVLGFLFFVYGLPMLRQSTQSSAPQINIPDKVDINVNQPK